ncbi:E3 ubiquitin-protein ligase NEURL1B, partial [Salvelinus sp. IW2-2015]|uniref:E3 ubiquitin-protein ligase NEURL1B n=1 Tax=Salvelinus sp. IW2-2015 TaxID=2691554 RepID=UPI0038D49BD8
VRLRLSGVHNGWSGALRFGFTSLDPSELNSSNIPKYACPDLVTRPGSWAKALPERLAVRNNVLSFWADRHGRVFYSINEEEPTLFHCGLSIGCPLWAIIDIYGLTQEVTLLESKFAESVGSSCLSAARLSAYLPQSSHDSANYNNNQLENNQATAKMATLQLNSQATAKMSTLQLNNQATAKMSTLQLNNQATAKMATLQLNSQATAKMATLQLNNQATAKMATLQLNNQATAKMATLQLNNCSSNSPTYAVLTINVDSTNAGRDKARRDVYCVCLCRCVPGTLQSSSSSPSSQSSSSSSSPDDSDSDLAFSVNRSSSESSLVTAPSSPLSPPVSPTLSSPPCLPHPVSPTLSAPELPSGGKNGECTVCFDQEVDTVIYTCGHMCLCNNCGLKLKRQVNACCPICRRPIKDVIKTYRP